MNGPATPLFRTEVLEGRAKRLYGDVKIAVPVSWQFVGYALLATLAAALLFLLTASYSRVETVSGTIVLDKGVVSIIPTRPGIVEALPVREGDSVQAGSPLVEIRAEEEMVSGPTAPRRIIEALAEQDRRLTNQTTLMMSAATAERSRLAAQIAGLRLEMASLETQIAAQRRLVEVAENEFRRVRSVAGQGYVSRRDVEEREGALLARRQQLAQLEQVRAAKRADLIEAERLIAQAAAAAEAQAAGVQSDRAALAQQLAQAEAAQGYALASPIAGRVTALTARLGHAVDQRQPLMVIVPANATTRAELYVPTSAAGFLAVGQEVRLAVDAFPYQQFGTVQARIAQISSVAIPRTAEDGSTVPVYLVTADLAAPSIMAFGRSQPLLSGMTLSARIVTQRQSLFEWLFEPLFAIGNR